MEVITIDSKAFQQLLEKVNAINDYVREARLEQTSNIDEEWVDSQVVCQYLRICEKTLQRLRSAGKISYSCVGNKYYYQIVPRLNAASKPTLSRVARRCSTTLCKTVYIPLKRGECKPPSPPEHLRSAGYFITK